MKTIHVKPFPFTASKSLDDAIAIAKAENQNEQLVAANERVTGVAIASVSWGEAQVVFQFDNDDELSVEAHEDGVSWSLKSASLDKRLEPLECADRVLGLDYRHPDLDVYIWPRAQLLEECVGKPLEKLFQSDGLFLYVSGTKPLWFTGMWVISESDDEPRRAVLIWGIPE